MFPDDVKMLKLSSVCKLRDANYQQVNEDMCYNVNKWDLDGTNTLYETGKGI